MKSLLKKLSILPSAIFFFFLSAAYSPADAHEVYVLSHQEFSHDMMSPTLNTLQTLSKPANVQLTITLVIIVSLVLILLFFLRYTKLGQKIDLQFKRLSDIGLLIIRLALSASFFYAAFTNSIFGPELSLSQLPFHQVLPFAEYAIGTLFLLGLFTEAAAFLALILYGLAVSSYGMYLVTYVNYLGEIIVLILFGSRFLSLDLLFFGKLKRFVNIRKYENTIIRICYGAALLYAAINIKVIHSEVALDVVNRYHLNQFHWLFPHDPVLIVLGAAIVEIVIALFIIFGFSVRITNIILMFYLTLSILFFKETVWPHYMLYGISLSLLFHGGGALSADESLNSLMIKKKKS